MENADYSESQWQTFRRRPAAFAHPRRVVHAFDALIGDDVAARLTEDERFRDRLSVLLSERYLLDDELDDQPPPVRRLALASPSELTALIRQVGAVYWARVIIGVIESKAVVALKQTLGEAAYAAALAHRDLASRDTDRIAPEEIDAAVTSAGLRCLAGWCDRRPVGLARRIRLKLDPSTELDGPAVPPFDDVGPRIVDRLIA